MGFDLLVKNARLSDGGRQDIGVVGERIVAVGPNLPADAGRTVDAATCLVSPPFVDAHFHMDATLSLGQPRLNESGTLLEGIRLWSELKPHLTVDVLKKRAHEFCRWAIARGSLAVRSHVDVCDDRLL